MSDVHKLRTFNDPILKVRCAAIEPDENLAWLSELERACYQHNGAGIAAPQIGIAKRAVFVRYGAEHGIVLVNPVLLQPSEETETDSEGCLSYPGIYTPVKRHKSVLCEWRTVGWNSCRRRFSGCEARVLQHEVEHLEGICRVGDAWRARHTNGASRGSMLAVGALLALTAEAPRPR